jgi:3-oxoadipate enol-lactonase
VQLDREFSSSGTSLRFADSGGRGRAVILTHGAGSDHHAFSAQVDALSTAGHRVVVWNLRGHGGAPAVPISAALLRDDLAALITHLGLERPALVGHSLGGNLSQGAVQRDPAGFSALVVLDSAWNTGPLSRLEISLLRSAAPLLGLFPARTLPRTLARASAVTETAQEDAERAFALLSKRQFIATWRATAEFVAPDADYRTPVPLTLVRGARDSTGNIATAMPRWAAAEGVSEHVVPDAGHLVMQDAPDAVSAILLDALS